MNLFGRNYDSVGSSNSDFLIKTKGQVKIQWGSKFIDLIKEGKINSEINIVKQVDSKDKIGTSDGFYIVDKDIYLKTSDSLIALTNEDSNVYVSLLKEQKSTAEQKYIALQNIGFIYKDLTQLDDESLKNGIIYVESEKKLYIVQDGTTKEYTTEIPSIINTSFTIANTDTSSGALIIKGKGVDNSIQFDNLSIYNEDINSFINSQTNLVIKIGNSNKLTISDQQITSEVPIISPSFKSNSFNLYQNGNESILEVDNIKITNNITYLSKIAFSNDNWTNSTLLNDKILWKVDNNNIITEATNDFIFDSGTKENWSNPIWQKTFLQVILCQILSKNSKYYNNEWDLNTPLKSFGNVGYWTANAVSNNGILIINNLSGQIIENNNIILFSFTNINIQELLNYKFSNKDSIIGNIVDTPDYNIYNMSYSNCYYKIDQLIKE